MKCGKLNETKIEDITLLYKYFKRENQKRRLVTSDELLYLKIAEALNISMMSVKRHLSTRDLNASSVSADDAKQVKKRKIDEFDRQQVRCTVHNLYRKRQLPTTTNILKVLSPEILSTCRSS